MSKVSIVVPIYNVERYLRKCLDSIIHQTFKDIEIILINDGSTDNSGSICNEYVMKDNRVKLITTPNHGSGEARNTGLQLAVGDYVYFCDPDDWLELNLISDNYNLAIEGNADIVFFGVNNYLYNFRKRSYLLTGKRVVENTHLNLKNNFPTLYKTGLASAVWNKLYKLSFLKTNRCVFPSYSQGQDWSFNLYVYRFVTSVIYNPKCYYNYVQYGSDTAITRYNKEKSFIRKNLIKEFSDLLDYWKMPEQIYDELLYRCVYIEISSELRNNFHFNSPDNLKTKYNKCKKLINSDPSLDILCNYSNQGAPLSEKYIIHSIKNKFVLGIMIDAYLRQIVRLYFKNHIFALKNLLKDK